MFGPCFDIHYSVSFEFCNNLHGEDIWASVFGFMGVGKNEENFFHLKSGVIVVYPPWDLAER